MRDGLLALLGVVAASGCSYDWTVSSAGYADASKDVAPIADAGEPDGTTDASTDVSVDVQAAEAAADATEAAPTLPSCTPAQEAVVQQARTAALACDGTVGQCETEVPNECDCPVVVGAENQAKANYVAAIANLQKMCVPLCPAGVGVCGTPPTENLCIVADAGSSALACSQE
jgi:hypothetical protein